jgi:hydrogenase expression/formation protein HypC
MCLAIPGKVLDIDRELTPVMGNVSFGGVTKRICLEWVPEIQVGQYVIVHVGFAISAVDEEDALETLRMLREMGDIEGEFGPGDDDAARSGGKGGTKG